MHDWTEWSIRLGQCCGITVRVHLLFVLMAVVLLALAPQFGGEMGIGDGELAWISAIALAVLLFGSLLHEFAHVVAVLRLGGLVDQVILGPIGGVTRCSLPPPPGSVWIAALAGPFANLMLAGFAAVGLALSTDVDVVGLFHPLAPTALIEGSPGLVAMKLAVWINWLLGLANLLPAFPFDGGTALRATLRPLVGSRTATDYAFRTALTLGVLLLVAAWFVRNVYAQAAIPAWLPLVTLAIFLFVSARRDARLASRRIPEDDLFGGGLLEDEDDLFFEELEEEEQEEEDAVLIESWRPNTHDENDRRGEPDDIEEARLDDVLARLHLSSIEQLSIEDRQLLERASERYRHRLRPQSPEVEE